MRNTKSKIRFLETFAFATFPIALAVGCSATGEKTASIGTHEEISMQQPGSISPGDSNTITYIETGLTSAKADTIALSEPQAEPEPQTASKSAAASEDEQASIEDTRVAAGDSTAQKDFAADETEVMPVNLQVPEQATTEKPQTSVFQFAFNKYDVAEQDYIRLKEHAEYLKENPDQVVSVNGYSDNRGSAQNNFAVSKKRAQQVADILMSYGVPQSQIKVNGYGESFPLNDENNWDENRRVELHYADDTQSDGMIVSAY